MGFIRSSSRTPLLGCLLIVALLPPSVFAQAEAVRQPTLRAIKAVLDNLPDCSPYLDRSPGDIHAPTEPTYMAQMRALGVRRASVWVRSLIRGGKPTQLAVEARVFFRHYDGPANQVVDPRRIARIKASGLMNALDALALSEAASSQVGVPTDQGTPNYEGKTMLAEIGFASDPWMIASGTSNLPRQPPPAGITEAAWREDAIAVEDFLDKGPLALSELNRALVAAAGDAEGTSNDLVIKALVRAGADVNTETLLPTSDLWTGTPLTAAVQSLAVCNVEVLLRLGADPNRPNALGLTPLGLARNLGSSQAERALISAGAKR